MFAIKQTKIGNFWISTSFLPLSIDNKKFETTAFIMNADEIDYSQSLYCERTETIEDALEEHQDAVDWAYSHE